MASLACLDKKPGNEGPIRWCRCWPCCERRALSAETEAKRLRGLANEARPNNSLEGGVLTYRIASHWDGRMSVLDGEMYDTYEAAFADCQRVGLGGQDDGMCAYSVDAGNEQAWLIYPSQEACDADSDGSSCVARIDTECTACDRKS